jgi:maleylpyruvate isomerase
VEIPPRTAIEMCKDAHQRLLATAAAITDDAARSSSRLPGWTVGHVLTHLARNADSHVRRLEGALAGHEVPRYLGGFEQRNREIEEGAARPAQALKEDLSNAIARLETIWERSDEKGWPNAGLLGGDHFPTSGSPLRRLREVEVHHVDLGLGYDPTEWPDDYVRWELPKALEGLPDRIRRTDEAKRLLAWLIGRAPAPDRLDLEAWM